MGRIRFLHPDSAAPKQSHVRPEDQLVAIDGVDLQGISLILIGFEDAN